MVKVVILAPERLSRKTEASQRQPERQREKLVSKPLNQSPLGNFK